MTLSTLTNVQLHIALTDAIMDGREEDVAAIIEVFPTGLNVHSRKYATDATVATLTTAAT